MNMIHLPNTRSTAGTAQLKFFARLD